MDQVELPIAEPLAELSPHHVLEDDVARPVQRGRERPPEVLTTAEHAREVEVVVGPVQWPG